MRIFLPSYNKKLLKAILKNLLYAKRIKYLRKELCCLLARENKSRMWPQNVFRTHQNSIL
ncbi:hypothetical protein NEOC65_002066 [Neochlamydia sp. AcF65]|nr:hypothetical protein [Neochlamydia sp. AcF65]MBS4169499.1 hypothetical protein [Neochlamydia sp. AcF95]NGY94272.1 hypothetical protein [Neochlamydia sp. AcF84]